MAFHFPLEAVLRYRESIEQREHLALEQIQQNIVRVEQRISQLEEDASAATHNRMADLAHGTRAAVVQSAYEYQKALEQQIQTLRALLQDLKIKWRQQLSVYEHARRNRETLEELRDQQLETYTREQTKRQQAVIDDLFLARRIRNL
ncbi:MAG: flagellar export protein FliJ [Terriglobales bacterium]